MTTLFLILDGLLADDFAEAIMNDPDDVVGYAEAWGAVITQAQAVELIEVGRRWQKARECCNSEWTRMYDEARAALGDEELPVSAALEKSIGYKQKALAQRA